MQSINNISIAINSLFIDITKPITLGLNKTNFFDSYKNINFKHDNRIDFEFYHNPIFSFDKPKQLQDFLERELMLSDRYQDNNYKNLVKELLSEKNDALTLGDFFVEYTIESNNDGIVIFFNTNSLVFKYEVIS